MVAKRSRAQPPRRATRSGRRPRPGQRGSGTLLVAAVIVVLVALTGALGLVGRYLAAAHAARGAADLAALSAAAQRARGEAACPAADRIAAANGVRLTGCRVTGDSLDFVVSVTVRQPVPALLPALPEGVAATAHAGRLGIIQAA